MKLSPPSGQLESWGRYPKAVQRACSLFWSTDPLPETPGQTVLPYGLGRSYGDSCLNDGNVLCPTRQLDHVLDFDRETGLIRCESGVSLDEVLQLIVPHKWFLPVSPGTKFVTVGGAIANDVHGKNHHGAGTFGCHVTRFELLRSDGERLLCSPAQNREWFAATIGGLGLTGLITWAEFKLRRVENAMIDMESVKFRNLEEFFAISADSDRQYEYTVAWLDCLAGGSSLGRGIFMRGNHAGPGRQTCAPHGPPRRTVPFDFPGLALNHVTIRAFNLLYYARQWRRTAAATLHYDPFFYPLDALNHWSRIYGRRGFFQYQFVVPLAPDHQAIRRILTRIAASGRGSFLAVMKTFGPVQSPGLLSFPRPGVTLALDFPNQGAGTLSLFDELDLIVLAAGGRIYPAKDARMSPRMFQECYPEWSRFRQWVDPRFSSSFWRRVTAGF
jgi:FAD/FMN-containing dehydrogenase